MKKFFSILLLCLWTLMMSAQSYSVLWKQLETAQKKDQPQSAISVLKKIQQKSIKEKSYGNLLAAMIQEVNQQSELSEDSMESCKTRLKRQQSLWQRHGNGVMSLLCRVAMGDANVSIDSLLSSPDAATYTKAEETAEWVPFLDKESDSKYFNNDLLHVIGMECGSYESLYCYYSSRASRSGRASDRKSACIAAALMLENSPRVKNGVSMADSLIALYSDLEECGAIAKRRLNFMSGTTDESGSPYTPKDRLAWIDESLKRWPSWKESNALRNVRNALTQPGFHASLSSNRINTMMPVELFLSDVRNIEAIKVTMTSDKGEKKHFSLSLPRHDEWELLKDTIKIGCLPLGRWTVLVSDGEGKLKSEKKFLFVTDLRIIQQGMPGDVTRYVVVNDITGQPVKGATLTVKNGYQNKQVTTFTTDENGEYLFNSKQRNNTVSATLGDDRAMPEYNEWSSYIYNKPSSQQRHLNIYTDRSIYRPGQTVHVAVVRHDVLNGTAPHVVEGDTVRLTLKDAQSKDIDERSVITDDYGTAAVDFTLPKEGLTGSYFILGTGKAQGIASFAVEEYRRPTFGVTLSEPSTDYKAGDTVTVAGMAKTYSGVAVANARVVYTVKKQLSWWWRGFDRFSNRDYSTSLLTDTIFTDADGKFPVRMPMPQIVQRTSLFYTVVAEATVMDNGGESHSATLSLPLSNRVSFITSDLNDKVLADTVVTVKVERRNASGKLIEGEVEIVLDGHLVGIAKSNQGYALPKNIVSGEHRLVMICGQDTLEKSFVAFRKSDKTLVTATKDWFYISGTEFQEKGDVWLQLGSTDKDVHVVYAIYSADRVLEKGIMKLDDTPLTRTFKYKKDYGDGITISLAWVKEGKMYSHTASIKKHLDSDKLTLRWTSFRNRLLPGQHETWTLNVTGQKKEKVQLMAVLYDKSLDTLTRNIWLMTDTRYLSLPTVKWHTSSNSGAWFFANAERKSLPETGMRFSSVATDCRYNPYERHFLYSPMSGTQKVLKTKSSVLAMNDVSTDMVSDNIRVSGTTPVKQESSAFEPASTAVSDIREDFSETAFFMPQLVSDAKGQFTIQFTLPQSVTTWRFLSLAHDKQMNFGQLSDESVAQKLLMLQAKMPRFLRVGDNAQITATVSNLSSEPQAVDVTMTLLDVKSDDVISNATKAVKVQANGTVAVSFDVDATERMTDGVVCRFMVHGKNFSDGEQHLLTVLSDAEEAVDTTSFVVDARKMLLDALPQMQVPETNNAITLSNAIYANVMTAHLKDTTVSAANDNVLVQLLTLQNIDGGFSWYGGMQSSKYITMAVVKTLVRMNMACGVQKNTVLMLDNAFKYLNEEMEKEKTWQKEHKTQYLSSVALDWLYALTLSGRDGGTAEKYFRNMLYAQTVKDDMQTKAVAGIIMNNSSQTKKAKEFAESIKQHTVYRADMGRYFDSYRADYSWCDFKIPTQTMCIEALDDITPMDTTTITEMQKWLVQCKRTQSWDNAINAVNAVYALSLNTAQKPFMAAYRLNPEDYKNIIKVSREESVSSKVGDKVKVKITIVADRDYDFVTVTDNRAACLEPSNQLSCYHCAAGGDGYYQETKDQKTVYHFNQLRKGTHTIETEYYIDRAGSYNAGKTTAVCEYAPEFRGSADGAKIKIR